MSRTTFYGFGAYVGSLRGLTDCAWWDDDPVRVYKFAQPALVAVDLSKNPSAARAGRIGWADVEADDHRQDGGLTTIGPMFPTGGVIGAIWLSEQYYAKLGNRPPRQPASAPNDAYDYEVTSYLYYDGEEGDRRFYGYHANIIGANGPLSNVEIWDAGTGKIKGRAPAGTWWLDLANVSLGSESTVKPNVPGSLFLDAKAAKSLLLRGPKKPLELGEEALP